MSPTLFWNISCSPLVEGETECFSACAHPSALRGTPQCGYGVGAKNYVVSLEYD